MQTIFLLISVLSTRVLLATAWGPWSDWSVCTVSCGKGEQMRVRICLDNSCNEPQRQIRECGKTCGGEKTAEKPPEKIIWGPWSDWSFCTASCGGQQMRVRICLDNKCQQPERQEKTCGKPCGKNKEEEITKIIWQPWSDWSSCTVSCGQGQQMRVRICSDNKCKEPEREQKGCGKPCKEVKRQGKFINWLPWSDWSVCSVSCGKGERMRVRLCLNNACEEPERERQECGKPCTDAEFLWQPWSAWSACSAVCGSGVRDRFRSCVVSPSGAPAPPEKCGKASTQRASCENGPCVVGGFASESGKWPWQVLIITGLEHRWQQCGGTLISSDWILSAAHCFLDPFGNEWKIQRITLGTTDRRGIGQDAINFTSAEVVHVHENFNTNTLLNDISLVKLPNSIDINKRNIQPAFLPSAKVKMEVGKSCIVTGWGATDSAGSRESVPDDLQEVDVKIFSDEDCKGMHHTPGRDGSYTKSHFCAGHLEGKKDSCGGDSGGPLVCEVDRKYVVQGITSSGPAKCGKENKPGIYTRVSDFIPWIQNALKGFRYHWTEWKTGKCSVTCGEGERTATRTCRNKDNKPSSKCEGISTRKTPCRRQSCVEFEWTQWEPTCSVTCGEGIEMNSRSCMNKDTKSQAAPNNCAGRAQKIGKCKLPDCIEYGWTAWKTTCSVRCGEGIETSTRECFDKTNNKPAEATKCPGQKVKSGKCKLSDCQEFEWTQWKARCAVTCGEGVEMSTRRCSNKNTGSQSVSTNCVGRARKIGKCQLPKCIEYGWTDWKTACGVTCGEGIETSTRECFDKTNGKPADDKNCSGQKRKIGKCTLSDCIAYRWTDWKSTCSVACGQGIETSVRNCVDQNDEPTDPGKCDGESTKVGICMKPLCNKVYQWTDWKTLCFITCGSGNGARVRSCVDNNFEVVDRSNCVGKLVEITTCTKPPCQMEYRWGNWSEAAECSTTCGVGQLEMKRKCFDSNNVEITDTSKCTPGNHVDFRQCNLKPCPVYKWSDWTSSCSVTCGTGVLTKTRNCVDQRGNVVQSTALCGPGSTVEKDFCTLTPCPVATFSWGPWSGQCTKTCGSDSYKLSRRKCLNDIGQEVRQRYKCRPGSYVKVENCPKTPCINIADSEPSLFNWGPWGSWSVCRNRIGSLGCEGFKSSTRDCLRGSQDVNPRMCSDAFPGEDFYRETTCIGQTACG